MTSIHLHPHPCANCARLLVYADGSICLDILASKWSPTFNVSGILTSIQSLLDEPNPNSPANALAAQLCRENRREYERRVRECVEKSLEDVSDDDEEEEDSSDEDEAEDADMNEAGTAAAASEAAPQASAQ